MKTVHMIGNAHLDPAWLWRWQEGYAEALATFRSALDRMDEFPDFVFTCGGAVCYQWVEETDPPMFAEIQRRVAQGRWVIVGGWHIQPDCNAPCGESFARHALYSQRYYRARFGRIAKVGYNVDSFGHNAMLPQILKLSGMDAYVYMRPDDRKEKQYPFPQHAFLWRAPDGSEVATYRIPNGYGSNPFGEVDAKARSTMALAEADGQDQMCFYGVGNHGGGPTIENLEAIHALMAREQGYKLSSPDAYFASLDASALPVLEGDLQHHASGCYTAHMEIKKLNRMAEARLMAAEKLTALSEQLGRAPEAEGLKNAWEQVLFNQFHDIMGGCCVRDAYDDARESLGEALSASMRVMNRANQWIAWNIDTSQGLPVVNNKHDFRIWERDDRGFPVTIFNPHGWAIDAPIELGVRVAGVTDENGAPIATQRVRNQVTNGAEDKWHNMIVAQLPPLGWRTYWLYKNAEKPAERVRALSASETRLENDFLIAEFDSQSGAMTRLYDKREGMELLARPSRALVIDEEHCDTWSHAVFSFRDEAGEFGDARLDLIEMGEVCARLRVRATYGASQLTLTYAIYRDKPGLFVGGFVNWQEKHKMLKLCYPTPFSSGVDMAAIPYGLLERAADGKEQPMRGWVMLKQGAAGLGVATDWCSAYDAMDGELRLTVLRSPIFADHFGVRDDHCEFTQQGEWTFKLALSGGVDTAFVQREAAALACPPERVVGTYHGGALPQCGSGFVCDAEALRLTVVKRSEDGAATIVRLNESAGTPVTARIELPLLGVRWSASFGPHQIKTFRIEGGAVREVNLLEE
ncbi:MAG: alpha-mannosidase [Clostridiales bacterium]|nr:alpha-mannosidase [Clostridiales bacterium]